MPGCTVVSTDVEGLEPEEEHDDGMVCNGWDQLCSRTYDNVTFPDAAGLRNKNAEGLPMRLGVIGGTGLVNLDLRQELAEDGEVLRQDDVVVDTAFGQRTLAPLLASGRRSGSRSGVFATPPQRIGPWMSTTHDQPQGEHERHGWRRFHMNNWLSRRRNVLSVCSVGAIADLTKRLFRLER